MVSPVKTFRRHRKQLLAILTILTVLSFVFVPIFLQILELRRGSRNPVVVTTKLYGDLRQSQVSNLLWQRGRWLGFLQDLQRLVDERQGGRFLIPYAGRLFLRAGRAIYELGPDNEESVVETWLLSRKAREMGITISDAAINRFLSGLHGNRVDAGQIKNLLKAIGLSQSALFEIIRNELSALRLRELLRVDLAGMTPAQRWDYFLRLRRKAETEAVPIDAEKLIARVPDPSSAEDEKELQALFEPYKDKRADPNSPEPGFREPHRVTLQYFRADLKAFLNPREVTEAAIEAYYKDHQDEFRRWVFPEVKVLPEKPPLPGEKKSTEPGNPAPPGKESPQPVKPKVEPGKPEPAKTSPPQTPPTKSGPPKPEPGKTPADKPGPAEKAPAKTSSSKNASETAFRLVSFPQEKPEKKEPPKGEAAGPSTKEATPKAAKPAEKPEPKPGPKLQTQPLEKVKDEIRDILAKQKAHERIAAAFTAVQDRMAKFEQEWMAYDALEAKKKEQESPPEPPDVGPIARASGLKPFRVGPVSDMEAEPLDIGKSRIEGSIPFVQRAFGQVRLYQAMTSQDSDGNEYLFWKVEDLPERVPNWDDEGVRSRVERAWKLIRARDIARQEAEALAVKAQQSHKPLKEVIAKRPGTVLLTPEPFAWLTESFPGSPEPPRLSQVKGPDGKPLAGLGNEFMEHLFAMPQGGVGWIWNQPQTIVYVVHVVKYQPLETTLWEEFVASPWAAYIQATLFDREVASEAWKKQLETEAGLRWLREPTRGRTETDFEE
jgi:hypothetical protein